jgi:Leu/Phe-tRNA-protein transferase
LADEAVSVESADLEAGAAGATSGIFPMPLRKKTLGWWSPDRVV